MTQAIILNIYMFSNKLWIIFVYSTSSLNNEVTIIAYSEHVSIVCRKRKGIFNLNIYLLTVPEIFKSRNVYFQMQIVKKSWNIPEE